MYRYEGTRSQVLGVVDARYSPSSLSWCCSWNTWRVGGELVTVVLVLFSPNCSFVSRTGKDEDLHHQMQQDHYGFRFQSMRQMLTGKPQLFLGPQKATYTCVVSGTPLNLSIRIIQGTRFKGFLFGGFRALNTSLDFGWISWGK